MGSDKDDAKVEEDKVNKRKKWTEHLACSVQGEDSDLRNISESQLEQILQIDKMTEWLQDIGLNRFEATQLLDALDECDKGAVPFSEFASALFRMRGKPRSVDTVLLLLESKKMNHRLSRLEASLSRA